MRIETERLILRSFEMTDFNDLYEYISDSVVTEFEPYKPMNEQETMDNLKWRCTTDEMIAVELKESEKVIGNVYLGNRDFYSKELGYVFNKHYWKKGYAKEACEAVVENAFSNGVHRIFAELDPQNTNSWKLMERLGFAREAHFKKNVYFWTDDNNKPIWKDTYVYAKISEV